MAATSTSTATEEAKLERFLQWLQVNGAELRGCCIKSCGPSKGFGVFASPPFPEGRNDDVLMVVPLDLAITPMRVLQDPVLGPRCAEMYKEGDVDDRFLIMLFLTVERLRPDSLWKPYIDILPNTFGSPLWFSDDELSELKGTALYRATMLQKKSLQTIFDNKVKNLVNEILYPDGLLGGDQEVSFEDFLWANSIFWTRALNIPFPCSFVFPPSLGGELRHKTEVSGEAVSHGKFDKSEAFMPRREMAEQSEASTSVSSENVWAEGLVPGIDFCNHDVKAAATWEVDRMGSKTGAPSSMYLLSAGQSYLEAGKEIFINYGNKGNEELLYLYGFVIRNNPDDYLMIHYPMDAFQTLPCADHKSHLLEIQKAELRCLLPRYLLNSGFFAESSMQEDICQKNQNSHGHGYSWSGHRKVPSYLKKLVFPEDFLISLRTISMREHEIVEVSSLLEGLTGFKKERQPSEKEVQAAIWEVCGDSGALQLLVDLLQAKVMELEEWSGPEIHDAELLEHLETASEPSGLHEAVTDNGKSANRNRRSCIVYRQAQKQLGQLFLKEAEAALDLCLREQS